MIVLPPGTARKSKMMARIDMLQRKAVKKKEGTQERSEKEDGQENKKKGEAGKEERRAKGKEEGKERPR